uniref:Putative nuclease HARBI1 n=1 Tax=Cyprinus carpio carpio TaxID=630221 RepID=A0A9J8DDJ6_CYPCA
MLIVIVTVFIRVLTLIESTSLRRNRSAARRSRLPRQLLKCLSNNTVSPTTYCHLNAAVPILRLYFEDGSDLRPNLRLSRQSIMSLIAALRSDSDHGWEKDIEVLVFLYWLAHAASYHVVSLAFDIPKSTVHDIVHRISRAVIFILRRVIAFPTPDDLEEVGAGFVQLAGSPAFRMVAGAIDGCHIRIKSPASEALCYFNRKLFHSVQLQAITDHKGKFVDIFVGYPGSVHDARVLKNSPVYTGRLYPPAGNHILGDGGYPCLSVRPSASSHHTESCTVLLQLQACSCT